MNPPQPSCGCKIVNDSGFHDACVSDMSIEFCPLHAHAEELLEMLRGILSSDYTGHNGPIGYGKEMHDLITRATPRKETA